MADVPVAVADRVEAVIAQMSSLFTDVDSQRAEEQFLMQERDHLQQEVSRVQLLVAQAEAELEEVRREADQLASARQASIQGEAPEALYAELADIVGRNTLARLDVETLEIQLEHTLTAAHLMMAEAGAVERDHASTQSYLEQLRAAIQAQDMQIDLRQTAVDQLRLNEDVVVQQEQEILNLKQGMTKCDLEIPTAPRILREARKFKARGIDMPEALKAGGGSGSSSTGGGHLLDIRKHDTVSDALFLSSESYLMEAARDAAAARGAAASTASASATIGRRIRLAVGVLRILSSELGMSVREKGQQLGLTDVKIATDHTQTVVSVTGPALLVSRFEDAIRDALRHHQAQDGLHTYKSNDRAVSYDVAVARLRQLLVHMSPQRPQVAGGKETTPSEKKVSFT
jgi:hypothetical protein